MTNRKLSRYTRTSSSSGPSSVSTPSASSQHSRRATTRLLRACAPRAAIPSEVDINGLPLRPRRLFRYTQGLCTTAENPTGVRLTWPSRKPTSLVRESLPVDDRQKNHHKSAHKEAEATVTPKHRTRYIKRY